LIITFEPEAPEGHPKYQKRLWSSFQSSNGLDPGSGKVGQGDLKVLQL